MGAYTDMWNVVVEASHSGDPDPEELADHASGDALELMRQTLQGASDDGVTVVGEPLLSPEVTESSEREVTILDCVDDSEWVEQGEASSSAEAEPGPRKVDATVSNDGLVWRVSELRIWEQGSC
ncbi:hypothetical protein [Nocardiopsis chromatogenes]|uniref:hypothetical protein n=1 Tax=Nocardiopsis chromatogenes TaxID=280239 RepID=UPI001EF9FA84|nr:hypothetical protein [Nocardiopsis chromatogenes]